ncbi:MAG TPA: response regulator [Bryobacteraceae bacterium]|jgi:two-component system chemotaxis response regulator CheY|nr:response regulator [Bryobacteraceae bacterium]
MKLRILIVDDSPAMRSFIKRVLDLSGIETESLLEAGDGAEALELLDREWVDVILTDINMPRMNGEEFVRRLSESGLTESLPVIVISTDATSVRKEHMTGLGARGYLGKPFQPEQLREEMERVLGVSNAA